MRNNRAKEPISAIWGRTLDELLLTPIDLIGDILTIHFGLHSSNEVMTGDEGIFRFTLDCASSLGLASLR